MNSNSALAEKAYLLGVVLPGQEEEEAEESLKELARLAESAGAQVAGQSLQMRKALDPATYLGSGKVELAKQAMQRLQSNLAIVDDELRPTQQRNLEFMLGAKVLDRTQLILDVFAQRARTNEGKLQVELAQLSYLLPRLGGWGVILSRLGGGIGTRGPGETKLESDRRRLRGRISQLQKEINQISKTRGLQRHARQAQRACTVALVGYTNAGKSSLFNALTGAGVFVQDRLFATLDPTIRPIQTGAGAGERILLADTVGFIKKLPHTLVAAFRATLEEVAEADLRLLVLDASSPYFEEQKKTVEEVMKEIGQEHPLRKAPTWLVFNKVDLLSKNQARVLAQRYAKAHFISALSRAGLDQLKRSLWQYFSRKDRKILLRLPVERAGLIAKYYNEMHVLRQEWKGEQLEVEAMVPKEPDELKDFVVKSKKKV